MSLVFWDPIVEKISKRLGNWKWAYFSLGSQITLIQACLSIIPLYFLSLCSTPLGAANSTEKIMRDFLWSSALDLNRDHLMSLEVCCCLKTDGFGLWQFGI